MSSTIPATSHLRRRHLLAIPLMVATSVAFADVSPALDRFDLSLGGYYANTSTTIGAGDKTGQLGSIPIFRTD
jgi:hypothetical protein